MTPLSRNSGKIWWLDPAWGFAFSGIVVIAAGLTPQEVYLRQWGTPKYVDVAVTGNLLLLVACALLGVFLARMSPFGQLRCAAATEGLALPVNLLKTLFSGSFALCLAGYASWGAVAVRRGLSLGMVLSLFTGSERGVSDTIKEDYLGTVTGLTTLTQFGIVAAVLGSLVAMQSSWKPVRWRMAAIFALALVRAALNSERLALIEIAVPLLVVLLELKVAANSKSPREARLLSLTPIVGAGSLYLVFAVSEYFRSWSNFYSGTGVSIWSFSLYRLLGYYITAQNNAAIVLDVMPAPIGSPFMTMNFLWHFPVVGELMQSSFSMDGEAYMSMLDRSGNAEFNNNSGLLAPMIDFGFWGAMAYWILAGLACGVLYRLFRNRNPFGLCLFPLTYLAVLEISRGLYWSAGRSSVPFCALLLVGFVIALHRKNTLRSTAAERPILSPDLA